jgi:hypothetical protein
VQGTPIVLSPLIDGRSETAIAASARLGFRGILAKRAGSVYVHSLSDDWVKRTFAVPASTSNHRGRISPPIVHRRSDVTAPRYADLGSKWGDS